MAGYMQEIENCIHALQNLDEDVKKTMTKAKSTAKSIRRVADRLDDVRKDCKIAHAAGTSASILGGVLTIGSGIATMMTAGAAAPLLALGIGFGAGGAATNVGTSIVEAFINSSEIQKAEKDLKKTLDDINNVNDTIRQLVLNIKDGLKLATVVYLAVEHAHTFSEPLRRILRSFASCAFHVLGNELPGLLQKVVTSAASASPGCVRQFGECVQTYVTHDLIPRAKQLVGQAVVEQVARQVGTEVAGDVAHAGVCLGKGGGQAAVRSGVAEVAGDVAQAGVDVGQGGGQAAVRSGVAEVAGDVAQAGVDVGQGGGQAAVRSGAEVAGDVAEAAAQTQAKLMIGVNAMFLLWDVIDLGFTIRDIVQNKGSEAARVLREKADELDQKVI